MTRQRTRASARVGALESTEPWDGTEDPRESAELHWICGTLAIAGAIALVASNVIGTVLVDRHDPIADTISDLAAGRWEIVQDVGLYFFAAGLFAGGVGAAHARRSEKRWIFAIFGLTILGLLVTVVAARNEYGDGDNEGVVVHIYLVYGLGALFVAVPAAMARGMAAISRSYERLSLAAAGLWLVGAPAFLLAPTTVDGLFERVLGLIAAAWLVLVGLYLCARARRA